MRTQVLILVGLIADHAEACFDAGGISVREAALSRDLELLGVRT